MADSEYGLVRRGSVPQYGDGSTSQMGINPRGEQLIASAQLPKVQTVSLGESWSCQIATGSAFTHVANMPTTRAELALYNAYPANGKTLVIDSVWWFALTSITAAASGTLIYQINPSAAALSNDTAQLINSQVGNVYGGLATRAVAVTTMIANKWASLGSIAAGPSASIGHGIFAEVGGGVHVRPGCTLGLNVVVGTATGTGLIGVAWHEVILPII